jgi:hypothetical protein
MVLCLRPMPTSKHLWIGPLEARAEFGGAQKRFRKPAGPGQGFEEWQQICGGTALEDFGHGVSAEYFHVAETPRRVSRALSGALPRGVPQGHDSPLHDQADGAGDAEAPLCGESILERRRRLELKLRSKDRFSIWPGRSRSPPCRPYTQPTSEARLAILASRMVND